MSFHGRVSGTKIKRALGVQAALEWAFRIEQAQLDLPLPLHAAWGVRRRYRLSSRMVRGGFPAKN
jgi:hypothetical protein